ncbi:MAG TPA: 16S rRNA (cytosine(967)-C(5))-methyltransferase RsmB [Steroidobacteraceae bacterium]|jgi:16S rRNA (cytosine967-C5)-methyltransferase
MSSDARAAVRLGPPPGAATLAEVARALVAVASVGQSSDKALAASENSSNRAAVRAITLGSLRWYLRLSPAVESLLDRPAKVTPDIRALLVASAHQIEYSRNAPELTVHLAVEAARLLGRYAATGLVNAVLRRFVSERKALLLPIDADLAGRTAHPDWLVAELLRSWPDEVQMILDGGNQHPPLILRLDLTRTSVAQYLAELARLNLAGRPVAWAPAAIELEEAVAIAELPGFAQGMVSVQDAGAQLAAPLLDARPGMRVLDACAAPGGKTGHILEYTPALGELMALDIDAARSVRISDNLKRLSRQAMLVVGDIRNPQGFWDGRPFDRILADVPCSATGVIRRHPDIKLLRRRDDIAGFARAQLEILHAAFGMLAAGGRLLYSTCSVLPAENEDVIERFLKSEPIAHLAPLPPALPLPPGAQKRVAGVQLLPGAQAGTDGFYYACLEKTAVGT